MEKLIRGDITEESMKELRRSMPKKQLMVFVSSTFLDTNLERDILHRKILPDLQRKAQQHEVQVILYDMRFGVKDENTKDHMTWVACKEAIQQCRDGSDGLFFLSLQADRYGYRPLPKYLDQNVLLEAVKVKDHTEDSLKVLKDWYLLDDNHSPPRYELRPLKVETDGKISDPEYWNVVLPLLRDSVFDSVAFETCDSLNDEVLLVNRSVTEWETLFGLDCDKENCYWVHRSFDKEKLKAFKTDPNHYKLTDGETDEKSTALKLDNLKAKMKSSLRSDQCNELCKQISPADYFDEIRSVDYLLEWERVIRDCLEKELEKVILKSIEWKKGFSGVPGDYFEEILHHCSTAFTKASSFFGREELVQSAIDVIKNGRTAVTENHSMFSGIDLGVVGKSGCGKTALMSKLALSSSLEKTAIPTVIRFCGTSKFSLNGLKLIQSISLQILAAYEKVAELEKFLVVLPSQDYKTAVETFQTLLTEYPVNLFIDSLDQLENRYEERSKLTFLRDIKPHGQSTVVVSTLPDEYEEDGKPGKYCYLCEKILKADNVALLEVGNIDSIEATVKELLVRRQRYLTNDQWIVTLSEVAHEPTILYINLAMEVVSQWRSFEKEVQLKPTVKGIIHQIFDEMERNFGKEFTAIAFSMISFSREGVNDQEMKDVLSLHDRVMEEICQYSTLHCFPMHVWQRLKCVVKNLVTEKENHCIRWYHRQLWETATERYSEKKNECHELMGRYFTNSIDRDVMKEKDVMEQPLVLNGFSIWLPECLVNRRRTIEGYYHLIEAGLLNQALEEICTLEFVCASGLCGDVFNLLRCLSSCLPVFKDNEDIKRKIDHYLRWIRKRGSTIASDPSWMVRSTAGEEPTQSEVRWSAPPPHSGNWNECSVITCARSKVFDNIEMDLVGHSDMVLSVSWNHDGSKIVSGSKDKTIKIWEGMNGELLNTLEGHSDIVVSVSWNHDGSKIVSGSRDKTVKVWDPLNGEILSTLDGTSHFVTPVASDQDIKVSVSWNHDGSKLASGWPDNTIKISDPTNGEVLKTMVGHFFSRQVIVVSWNHNSSKIASGTLEETNIFDAKNGKLLNKLKGRFVSWHHDCTQLVYHDFNKFKICDVSGRFVKSWKVSSTSTVSASLNHDGSRIVSATKDVTIPIWDAVNGVLLKTLSGHSRNVTSVSYNYDGSKIVSGSEDKTIKIWDACNEEVLKPVQHHSESVCSVSWNCDGTKLVSSSYDTTIKIWDGANGQLLKTLKGQHSLPVNSVSWNRDGSRIASGSWDNTIRIWDAISGNVLNSLVDRSNTAHSEQVTSVSWNHNGSKIVSGSKDRTIKIWDVENVELWKTLGTQSYRLTSVSCNHDGSKIASGSKDRTIKIWSAVNGELLNTLTGHSNEVTSVAWNPDSTKIVSGSIDRSVLIWDAVSGEVLKTLPIGDFGMVLSVSWSHDGSKVVAGSGDNTIKIWHACSGELLNTLKGHSVGVTSVCWNHDDSKLVSGSQDGTIKIWHADNGQLLNTLKGHSYWVYSVSWNPDGSKIVSGSSDKTIKIWNAVNGELLNTLEDHIGMVLSVSWNPDGSKVVSGSRDKTIKIWNAVNGELLNTLEDHIGMVLSVSWNHDGSKIVSTTGDYIEIKDAITGELLNPVDSHSAAVISVSWNPDSSKIASGSQDKMIKIWDTGSGGLLKTLKGHSDVVVSVSWNHIGNKIISGSPDKTIKIWDGMNGELLHTLEGHSAPVIAASWNHDGTRIVSGSHDRTIRIWDGMNGLLLNTLRGHSDLVTSVSWNHDATKIGSGSMDRIVKIWSV
jgi:WD40 repeat protein